MEYSELIRRRESIRNYDPDRSVPKKILMKILNPGKNQVIFGISSLGYPKSGFRKTSDKKRKPLEEVVEFL